MRRISLGFGFILVAAAAIGLAASRTPGQEPDGAAAADATHRKITVTGTGTVSVRPDTSRVSFSVKGSGDFKSALAECDKQAADVEKAIKALKLKGLEVKKGPIHLANTGGGFGGGFPGSRPFPGGGGGRGGAGGGGDGGGGGQPGVPGGFGQPFPGPPPGWPGAVTFVEVSRNFSVIAKFGTDPVAGELTDIVAVSDKILAAAVNAGAIDAPVFNPQHNNYGGFGGELGNSSSNSRIEFYRGNPETVATLRREVLNFAVDDALKNAKAAAGVANLTAKDIVDITDLNQFGGPFGISGQPMGTSRGEVLGEQELTIQVSVTFSY
jgi:uncharacterized protein YggE